MTLKLVQSPAYLTSSDIQASTMITSDLYSFTFFDISDSVYLHFYLQKNNLLSVKVMTCLPVVLPTLHFDQLKKKMSGKF